MRKEVWNRKEDKLDGNVRLLECIGAIERCKAEAYYKAVYLRKKKRFFELPYWLAYMDALEKAQEIVAIELQKGIE